MAATKTKQMQVVPVANKSMELHFTENYELFKQAKHNRRLNERHVAGLMESIEQFNFTAEYPVLVTPDMVIFDGQHRFEACKRLDYPVYYRIIRVDDMEAIISINHNVLRWNIGDYLNYLAANGNTYAEAILVDIDAYNVTPSCFMELILGRGRVLRRGADRSSLLTQLARIKYTKAQQKEVEAFFERAKAFDEFCFCKRNRFLLALNHIMKHPKYSQAHMESQIEKYSTKLKNHTTREGFELALVEFYNYNAAKSNRISNRPALADWES